ncbi:S9 family peptidase [uncultured Hymenobacter sp.]|uniref:S9 family peptidase n=1 Tax=uncultured Hymenobacter sp. TaxID=170016 RepID=UPI0035CB91F8
MKLSSLTLALLLAANGPALLPGLTTAPAAAQQKLPLTLEDVFAKPTFRAAAVPGFDWMRDGRYYAALDEGSLVQHEVATGKAVQTLVPAADLKLDGKPLAVDGYRFNADEQKILFTTDTEPIYRHSSKASYYVYDRASKKLTPLSAGGKQSYATFSPDGLRVAFVRDNNVLLTDLATMQEKAVTTDGIKNQRINGSTDWVYEEEFSFAQGFFWSPDSKYLAYYTFDESQVPEYDMQLWGNLYPKEYRFKYPKAGEKNSAVGVSTYDVAAGRTQKMDVGPEPDQYLPRVTWTQTPGQLSIRRLNRLQNKLEVIHANAATGQGRGVLTETDPAYLEVADDDLRYLQGGREFLFASERDGFRNLYLYNMSGKLTRQLTKGRFDVSEVVGVDEKNGFVYYTSPDPSPLQRHLFRVSLKGGKTQRLSEPGAGTDAVNMSPDCRYFLNTHSSAGVPAVVSLREGATGKLVKTLEDNAPLRQTLSQYNLGALEFISFKTSEGVQLNGSMLKPANFDPSKKYPVLMYVYGGPGSQTVADNTGAGVSFRNYLYHQLLAQNGYLVVSVDNRGTGARGGAFRKTTYANLGKLETIDQGEAAKYLGTLPYVDKSRIGIWGWSFGGYMTALAMTKNADLFKLGISVAPVTNWRYYDSIYTERYLKTPQLNAAGYDDNSPVQFAQNLKGKYLLVHGTGDDNVHFQNSIAWVDAMVKANKDYQTLYYPNRNHGISGGNTTLHLYRQMMNFVLANL